MASNRTLERKSIHQLAFAHYLRTGQKLTNEEWRGRYERKFNPYHDERGRFTSPPGATVSWGSYQATTDCGARVPRQTEVSRNAPSTGKIRVSINEARLGDAPRIGGTPPRNAASASASEFRSEFVRNATTPGGHAETYFELNKRQTELNQLRAAAGAHPDVDTTADLDEIQRRYDADRARLDERTRQLINPQTTELLRAGLAPVDVAAGGINIAIGKGEVRDYFSVAGAIPLAGIVRGGGKLILGGARSVVSKTIKEAEILMRVQHHGPAQGALKEAGIIIPESQRAVIAIKPLHHEKTGSWGSRKASKLYREVQAKLLKEGRFSEAMKMDADDIDQISPGEYSDEIEQFLRYSHDELWSKRNK
jgi:hypothetical protein